MANPATGAAKKASTSQTERKKVMARKKKVFEKDAENFSKIIYYKSTGGFWVAGGHSVIMLRNMVFPEVRLRTPVRSDTDYDFKFPEGIISVGDIERHVQRIEQCGLLKPPKKTEDYIVFELVKPLSEGEFEAMKREKEIAREKIKNMIVKVDPMPGTTKRLEELYLATFNLNKKEHLNHGDMQKYVTEPMMDWARKAYRTVVKINRGDVAKEAGLLEIKACLLEMSVSIVELVTIKATAEKRIANVTRLLTTAMAKVEAEIAKCKKKY